jgi:hypothetical protein
MAYSTYIQNMVDRVAAYAQRSAASFVVGTNSVDQILAAMNDARTIAQQAYDFGQLKTTGAIQLNGSSGAPWAYPAANYGPYTSDAGTGTTGALRMKSYDMLFNYTKDTSGNMQPTNRITFDNSRWFNRLLPTNMGFPFTQVYPQVYPPFYYNTIPTQQMFAYVVGSNLFVNTCNQPSWFMFFGIQKLPDLTGSETSDFFIDNYQAWLLLATLQMLNNYLKEDQRVAISATLVNKAWEQVVFDDTKKEYQGVEWTGLD